MTLLQHEFLPTKSYTFQTVRYMLQGLGILPGCTLGGDFLPSQRGAGANLSIDVAAGSAWVLGQGAARQGMYHVTNDATLNVASFTAGDGTNPRIDQVILVANDTSIAGASDAPQLVIVTGVATAGATLANRSGAVSDATLTSTYKAWMRICDVLMPVSASSVTTANIKERRPKIGGKVNTLTTETRAVAAYGLLTTPDQVNELVVPPDALLCIGYEGIWNQSVANDAFAAIFLGTNQLKVGGNGGAPVVQEASQTGATGDGWLHTTSLGLVTQANTGSAVTTVTTGKVVGHIGTGGGGGINNLAAGGGLTIVELAAGTYDVSVQFKAAAGTVTVKNRKLWVWVEDPYNGVIG